MKMFRKLVSIVAAATLLTSSMAFTFSANAAQADDAAVASQPNIQDDLNKGVILHAFNWSYNSIKQNLPQIAAAGYSAVQTSPVTQPKDYGPWTDISGQWSKLYQPVSESIAQTGWLGTKAELTELCTEADKYGIKIIVDIVANHMANYKDTTTNTVNANKLSDEVKTYEPQLYNGYSQYFHGFTGNADSDSDTQKMVQGHVSDCPDLNTGNSFVQDKIYNLLKECIDCGVDGFRFDAAKHIETEKDGSYASNFWQNTLDKAKTYYTSKTGKQLFAYGEILNSIGSRDKSGYTNRMRVTENKYSDSVLAAVNSGSTGQAASTSYQLSGDATKAVIWAESHDTYMGESGSAGMRNTSKVDDSKIVKAWAILAARKDAVPLYFARPGSSTMGQAAGDLTYKSTVVSEVNKFHNAFANVTSEKVGTSGSFVYVARGNAGVVLSNINGNAASASVSGTGLADGTYTDTVTGNKFTVSGGTLTGNVGSTGVAVIYNSTSTPKAVASVESGSFTTETITVKLTLENAVSGTYALENYPSVSFTGSTTIKIGSDYAVGETITLNLTATDASGNTAASTYIYQKKPSTTSGVFVFLKPSIARNWSNVSCYVYDEDTKNKTITYSNGGWPGQLMTYDEALGYYYIEIPARCVEQAAGSSTVSDSDFNLPQSSNTYVIFNGAKNGVTTQYPAANALAAQKLKLGGGTSNKVLDAANASGWKNTTMMPSAGNVQATDVTKGGEVTEPTTEPATEPATEEPTTEEPTTEEPTEPETRFYEIGKYGDANTDGKIDIKDVTAIQRHIAEFEQLSELGVILANVDKDEQGVSIKDVTYIQRYLAEFSDGYAHTGEIYGEFRPVDPSGEKFTVTAKSNLFATKTAKLDADTPVFTVTYFINSEKSLLNTDWVLTYDATAVTPVNSNNYMPVVNGLVYNEEPDSIVNAVAGNYANIRLVPLKTADDKQVPFVSATFRVVSAKDTTVNLNVKDLTVSKLNDGETTSKRANETDIIENNTVGKPNSKYTLVTSVYGGPLNEAYTNASDPVVNYDPAGPGPIDPTNPTDPTDPTDPTQPTTEPVPATTRTILFSNNKGWTNVCIHYWGSASTPDTEWPGVPMTLVGQNEYQEDQYSFDIYTDVAGFVINGEGGQTTNITYEDGVTGWYPLDETDDEGHYLVGSWVGGEIVDPTDPIIGGDTRRIEFTDNQGWGQAYIYFITAEGAEETGWPGVPVNQKGDNGYGGTNYWYEIPANTQLIVFNDGKAEGGEQTVDVIDDGVASGWYPTEKNDEGKWNVDSWVDGGDNPGGTRTILFTNNKGWGSVNIHYWGGSGGDTEWPGVPMNSAGNNGFGEPQYSFDVPTDVEGMVFNDGNGAQTENAYYDSAVTGWYPLDELDSEGHYKVATWSDGGGSTLTGNYYLVGYINGEDYSETGYAFNNGTLTVNFEVDSYVCVRDAAGNWFMANGFPGEGVTSTTLYSTDITGEKSDKLWAPSGQVTFTLTSNGDGTFTLSEGEGGEIPPSPVFETREVQFTNNNGWSSVYAYAWNDTDGELLGAWPGTQMTSMGDNGMGSENFSANVPTNAAYIIFNGGVGAEQTVDLPYSNDVTGWYLNGTANESGLLYADTWTDG